MQHQHRYSIRMEWTGNRGTGTSGYKAYGRDHLVHADGKPVIAGSSDRVFHGDADRWNPEELLLAALSQCHMLSFLHVASSAGVVVTGYTDAATGVMRTDPTGGGRFTEATLHPVVTVAEAGMREQVAELHALASSKCFIAASVNFPVHHAPTVEVAGAAPTGPAD